MPEYMRSVNDRMRWTTQKKMCVCWLCVCWVCALEKWWVFEAKMYHTRTKLYMDFNVFVFFFRLFFRYSSSRYHLVRYLLSNSSDLWLWTMYKYLLHSRNIQYFWRRHECWCCARAALTIIPFREKWLWLKRPFYSVLLFRFYSRCLFSRMLWLVVYDCEWGLIYRMRETERERGWVGEGRDREKNRVWKFECDVICLSTSDVVCNDFWRFVQGQTMITTSAKQSPLSMQRSKLRSDEEEYDKGNAINLRNRCECGIRLFFRRRHCCCWCWRLSFLSLLRWFSITQPTSVAIQAHKLSHSNVGGGKSIWMLYNVVLSLNLCRHSSNRVALLTR